MPLTLRPGADAMLRLEQLSLTYPGGRRALDDLSLSIAPGVFGLLGPNGAGKSTLMRILATLQSPDCGQVHFRGIDALREPERLRPLLGYLPQDFGLYPAMSVEATLDHFANLKGLTGNAERRDRVAALLQQVNLFDKRNARVSALSGGMKQRLGIAIALVGRPALVVVDEPTAGLDPEERNRLLDLLAAVGDSALVILSTHIVEDVRDLCARIAVMNGGRILADGAPLELLGALRGSVWRKSVPRAELLDYQARYQVISSRLSAGATIIHVFSDTDPGDGFTSREPALDDVYFRLV